MSQLDPLNPPCPCGSGLDLEHCCSKPDPGESHYGEDEQMQVWERLGEYWKRDEFTAFLRRRGEAMVGLLPELDEETTPVGITASMIDWPVHGGRSVAGWWLAREHSRLQASHRSLLAQLVAQPFSLYEVTDTFPGQGIVLRDRLRNFTVRVREPIASSNVKPGWFLYCRVRKEPDLAPVLEVPLLTFDLGAEDRLEAWLATQPLAKGADPRSLIETVLRLWPAYRAKFDCPEWPKEDENSTNDGFMRCDAQFSVDDRPKLVAALKAAPDWEMDDGEYDKYWTWYEGIGSQRCEAGRLSVYRDDALLDVQSERRLAIVCAFLESIDGVRHMKTDRASREDLAEYDREIEERGDSTRLLHDPVFRAFVAEKLTPGYRRWLDEMEDEFQGRTPREMAKIDPKAVARKIWRIANSSTGKCCELDWMYAELGVPRLGVGPFLPGVDPVDEPESKP